MVSTDFMSREDQSVSDSGSECSVVNQLDQQWTLTYVMKPVQSWFICLCRSFTTKYSPSTSLVNSPDTEYLYPGVHSWSLCSQQKTAFPREGKHISHWADERNIWEKSGGSGKSFIVQVSTGSKSSQNISGVPAYLALFEANMKFTFHTSTLKL